MNVAAPHRDITGLPGGRPRFRCRVTGNRVDSENETRGGHDGSASKDTERDALLCLGMLHRMDQFGREQQAKRASSDRHPNWIHPRTRWSAEVGRPDSENRAVGECLPLNGEGDAEARLDGALKVLRFKHAQATSMA